MLKSRLFVGLASLPLLWGCVEQDPGYEGDDASGTDTGSGTGAETTGGADGDSSAGADTTGTSGLSDTSGTDEGTGPGSSDSGWTSTSTGSGDTSTGSTTGGGSTSTSGSETDGGSSGTTGESVVSLYPIADSYIRSGSANVNHGTEPILSIQKSGNRRALLEWDMTEVEATVGSGTLIRAEILLFVVATNNQWGTGRAVNIHRLLQTWTETAVTWNCAIDSNPGNSSPDCPADAWDMGSLEPIDSFVIDTEIIFNETLDEWIELDVTVDLQDLLAGETGFGWILKKGAESQGGSIELASRQHATEDLRPRLQLTLQ